MNIGRLRCENVDFVEYCVKTETFTSRKFSLAAYHRRVANYHCDLFSFTPD